MLLSDASCQLHKIRFKKEIIKLDETNYILTTQTMNRGVVGTSRSLLYTKYSLKTETG